MAEDTMVKETEEKELPAESVRRSAQATAGGESERRVAALKAELEQVQRRARPVAGPAGAAAGGV